MYAKTKGFGSTVGAVTALVCFCLGICYGSHQHELDQRVQNYEKYSYSNATQSPIQRRAELKRRAETLKAVKSPVEHIADISD